MPKYIPQQILEQARAHQVVVAAARRAKKLASKGSETFQQQAEVMGHVLALEKLGRGEEAAVLRDWLSISRIHERLKQELEKPEHQRPFIDHLKQSCEKRGCMKAVYNELISTCQTHGLSIKQNVVKAATDLSFELPEVKVIAAREAMASYRAVKPLSVLVSVAPPSSLGKWALVAVGATAAGALAIHAYGKSGQKQNSQSASVRERQKNQMQRAEDIAYTINHSLYCTLTDFINPPINAATDGYLRWLIPGCGHDHSKDGGHHHHEHGEACSHHHEPQGSTRWEKFKNASKSAFSKQRFIDYAKGEFVGDFGAVPITIAAQRFFPSFMHGLRKISEPLVRPLFKFGIERSTKKWAKTQGFAEGSPEYEAHKREVYEHEISHFPQAIIWTGASLGGNIAYQMHADKTPIAFERKLALKSSSVLSGVLVTAGMVVAARALAPDAMHRIDRWTSHRIILPTTKAVGGLVGVDEAAVDRMASKEEALAQSSWQQRLENGQGHQSATLRA
jgi:hypothetical protein